MRVLVSGASGLIGSALIPGLQAAGHHVTRLVRREAPSATPVIPWDPQRGQLDASRLEGMEALVHLAGEPVFGLWTASKKAAIRDSRVRGTQLLAQRLASLPSPPRVLINASAIGYYGHRGDEALPEDSAPGRGFLAETCREWEAATEAASARGIRVVRLRTSVVLSARGGALAKMLPAFRLGLGGRLGSGRQWLSWIAIDDVVGAVLHLLQAQALSGPVNLASPSPVTNAEFSAALGRALRRPAALPVPAAALRLLLGEMADEALLASARVMPAVLLSSGYRFAFPQLDSALAHVLRS